MILLGRENLLEPGEDLEGVLGVGGHEVKRSNDGPGFGPRRNILGKTFNIDQAVLDVGHDQQQQCRDQN